MSHRTYPSVVKWHVTLTVCLVVIWSGSTCGAERRALLVGCTVYDHLDESLHLHGPANDVDLIRMLLVERFGISDDKITTLSESAGGLDNRPIRENIVEQMRELARVADVGDQVVVYFSGHGSRQPDDDMNNAVDPEPDGFDEVFCPADVASDPTKGASSIPGAISDDELLQLILAIRNSGASVWVIVDACHAGTVIRGSQTLRQIQPNLLLPGTYAKEPSRLGPSKKPVRIDQVLAPDATLEGIVAMYAAQSDELAIETPLPAGESDARTHGLFTYHLVETLTQVEEPLTYAELGERVHAAYLSSGRLHFSTPLVEGGDRHREVLGLAKWPDRSRIQFKSVSGEMRINAGQIHGVTDGAIVAVFPPPGKSMTQEPLGYVRVVHARLANATVEPCDQYGKPVVRRNLPQGGRCRVVHYDYGDLKLNVAVDAGDVADASIRNRLQTCRSYLEEVSKQENSLIDFKAVPQHADWLLRPSQGDSIVLLPAQGSARSVSVPMPPGEDAREWLLDRMQRIARATNLLRVAGKTRQFRDQQPDRENVGLDVHFVRYADENDIQGRPVNWEDGELRLTEAEQLVIHVRNASKYSVDVNLIFIDSGLGIQVLYPQSNLVADNRLEPDEVFQSKRYTINAATVGTEHLVVIAPRSVVPPHDFNWLTQETIEQARNIKIVRGAQKANPLRELLEKAMYGTGATRGLGDSSAEDVEVAMFSWTTVKKQQP